jgi:steroid 5-alpha reductase family enzyme
MRQIRHVTAHIVFIAGLFFMVLGSAFLLGTMTGISRLSVLWSFLFVIIGAIFAVFAIKLNKRSVYLFFASFFILMGSFLFLSALKIIPFSLAEGWPLLSVFAGLALLPAGWRHYRSVSYRYLIPALAFVGMGCVLLIFSFKVAPFSFKRFIITWWPLLLVVTGIILVLLSLGSKGKTGIGDDVP